MGIFDKIKSAIWGEKEAAPSATRASATPQKPPITASASGTAARQTESAPAAPTPTAKPASPAASASPAAPASTASPAAPASPAKPATAPAAGTVDVAAMLDAAVARKGQKLNWRRSIVDLMKALDLDSSLANRRELAKELHFTGDASNSAAMNMWLHKALMKKLAENGGRVPADLVD
jgi:hypothetical protein